MSEETEPDCYAPNVRTERDQLSAARRVRRETVCHSTIARCGQVATSDEPSRDSYGLGHADDDLERLRVRARVIVPTTIRWFVEAAIIRRS
jgi:hypothetical protein